MTRTVSAPPASVDRLIVHQFDPARPSPGGIDSCLRGILRYRPADAEVAVVGVDAGGSRPERRLGRWEQHRIEDGPPFWFLPVVRLDPVDQARKVPHALRLMAGLFRYRHRLPAAGLVQVHRMDSALALRRILGRPVVYFIHTQENGLTGSTSDSFWRFSGRTHRRLEQHLVRRARTTVVFNESYSQLVRQWNPHTFFSPTWYDPGLLRMSEGVRDPHRILWVGRFEVPKDPQLAVEAFAALVATDAAAPWSLEMLGTGTLLETVSKRVATLSDDVRSRIILGGRVRPEHVAEAMAGSGVFLMTSHPGYEGYPRVLVEALASGLPAVVTSGSDTGGLVVDGRTGFTAGRDPDELAALLQWARLLDRGLVRAAAVSLDAPSLVGRIFALDAEAGELAVAR